MPEVELMINGLEEKINQLIGRYTGLQQENARLLDAYRNLQTEIEKQNQYMPETTEQSETEIPNETKPNQGKVEMKARINELLREIDKCIGLLNR